MQDIVAYAPRLNCVAPLLQPEAGPFLHIAIWIMMQGFQGIEKVLTRHCWSPPHGRTLIVIWQVAPVSSDRPESLGIAFPIIYSMLFKSACCARQCTPAEDPAVGFTWHCRHRQGEVKKATCSGAMQLSYLKGGSCLSLNWILQPLSPYFGTSRQLALACLLYGSSVSLWCQCILLALQIHNCCCGSGSERALHQITNP